MTGFSLNLLGTLGYSVMVGCGLIFLAAGIEKLRHRDLLPGVIANYRLLPPSVVPWASTMLGPVECLVGILLLSGTVPVPGLVGAALFLIFAAGMGINIRRGRAHIHCGCGRPELQQQLRWSLVLRNTLLALLLALSGAIASPLSLTERASSIFAGLSLFIVYRLFEAIGALGATSRSR